MAALYRAFDRVISSEVALPLLQTINGPVADDVVASITFSSEPVTPEGDSIGGSDATTFTLFSSGDNSLIALNRTGWIAQAAPDATGFTLSLDSREEPGRADRALSSRILGDRLVTSLVPFFPQLWGHIAVHGALLAGPHGQILLLGQSGYGKSTLSQVLSREHGWAILDDDTSMIVFHDNEVRLVPMGARSRVRSDVARAMNLSVEALPGHGGQKGALLPSTDVHTAHDRQPLCGIVFLAPRSPGAHSANSPVVLEWVEPTRALGDIVASFFYLWPHDPVSRQNAFRAAASLTKAGLWQASFVRGDHSPNEVANRIADAVLGSNSASSR